MGSGFMTSSATPASEIAQADDWLDGVLRDAGREHRNDYIADDGFTRNVMAKLPEGTTLPAWRRPVVAMLWVLAAAATISRCPAFLRTSFAGRWRCSRAIAWACAISPRRWFYSSALPGARSFTRCARTSSR